MRVWILLETWIGVRGDILGEYIPTSIPFENTIGGTF